MFFVIDENNNKIEAYDKEGVLAVLSKAIKDGSLSGISADAGFVSKLKCCVGGDTHPVAFVSQAKYNELEASGSLIENCIYYITDDTTAENIDKQLKEVKKAVSSLYVHRITMEYNEHAIRKVVVTFNIINGKADQLTAKEIYDYILGSQTFARYPVSGYRAVQDASSEKYIFYPIIQMHVQSDSAYFNFCYTDVSVSTSTNYGYPPRVQCAYNDGNLYVTDIPTPLLAGFEV